MSRQKLIWKPGTMLYPVPVVMVSCGRLPAPKNIITVAWAGITCSDPPLCSISIRPNRYSHGLIREYGDFCINLTTRNLVFATDWCGVKSGRDIDKFEAMKLTALPASKVGAPLIAESPLCLECVVRKVLPLGSHDMFLAEIVAVQAGKEFYDPRSESFALEKAEPICYAHGKYFQLGRCLGRFGFSVEKKKTKRKKAVQRRGRRTK